LHSATAVTEQQYIEKIREDDIHHWIHFSHQLLEHVPTEADIFKLCASASSRRAPGPDGIPAELFKFCGPNMRKQLHALVVKSLLLMAEPQQWTTGLVCTLYKGKGSHDEVGSYRGIWLLSALAKVYHRWLARKLNEYVDAYTRPSQFGCISGRCIGCAGICVSAFMQWAMDTGTPAAILFIDVNSAFDKVLREVLVGITTCAGGLHDILVNAGIAEKLARKI